MSFVLMCNRDEVHFVVHLCGYSKSLRDDSHMVEILQIQASIPFHTFEGVQTTVHRRCSSFFGLHGEASVLTGQKMF